MPTIHRERGFRFFFSSLDRNEPPHVHVASGDGSGKIWLSPVHLAWSIGFDAGEVRDVLAIVRERRDRMEQAWLTTSARSPGTGPKLSARAVHVHVSADLLQVRLEDGRALGVPIVWFPRLEAATEAQRLNWKLIGHGVGIHWPEIGEDILVEVLLGAEGDLLAYRNGVVHDERRGIELSDPPTASANVKDEPPPGRRPQRPLNISDDVVEPALTRRRRREVGF